MRFLRRIPIRQKLTLIIMLTSGVALLLASIAFVGYDQLTFRRAMVSELSVLTDMFDDNVAPGLTFNDPKSVEQTLNSLQAHPHVLAAAVYDQAGQRVAEYRRADMSKLLPVPPEHGAGFVFQNDRLDAFRSIVLTGETIGTIYIASDLHELTARFRRYAVIVSLVLVLSSLVAFGISTQLQQVISGPISHLASVANTVATEKDYSVRAVRKGDDELGRLIDGFNEMLNQIQARDSELQEARSTLEKRVERRTLELSRANAELRDVAARFHTVWESAHDAMRLLDGNGLIVAVNAAFCRLFGMRREELVGAPFTVTYAGNRDPAELLKRFQDRFQSNQIVPHMERRMVLRDGRTVELEIASTLIEMPGSPALQLVLFRDITERKRAAEELEQTHQQLVETSRQAGMAEVATGVLHNVGNVLNSVNVSSTLVTEQLKSSRVANLAKVAALMQEHAATLGEFMTNDPKGRQLPGYLAQLAGYLRAEQAAQLHEMQQLQKNVEHIKDIVAMQQNYAKVSRLTETLQITELIEDALRMNAGALKRHEIQLVREISPLPPITVDRHKVLQILINLIRNAKYACDASARTDKRVTVRATNGEGRVKICIVDNGVGIPPENLVRIFNHGFTTRNEGHGFGLHSAALAAKELGGAVLVRSDGPGCGAAFTLELPVQPL